MSLHYLYRHMSLARRRQMHFLLGLMLIGAFAELSSIGAVVPFVALLSSETAIEQKFVVTALFAKVGAESRSERLLTATILFSILVVLSGIVRFHLASRLQRFAFSLAHELTLDIQRRFLFQPYCFHVQRNTGTLVSSLEKVEVLVFEVLMPLMQAAIAAFIAIFIVAAIVATDPAIAIMTLLIFAAVYWGLSARTKARLATNSDVVSTGFDERMKIVQESLGGIRDVIIDGSQAVYLAQLERENLRLSIARADTAVVAAAPRFVIETIGIVAMAGIAIVASRSAGGLASALPTLGVFALGAQRLLPLVQQIYGGASSATGNLSVVQQTKELLQFPVHDEGELQPPPLSFKHSITVANVSLTYPTRRNSALAGVSLEVPAGSAIGLIGETGSGKSTLADLMMGLLDPDEGTICIDGVPLTHETRRQWQRCIAHVPQSIFLIDATIAENIALSLPTLPIDYDRVIEAAKVAQLHDFVTSLPDAYSSVVGERGIRLSGGQRQRLGIARALYKHAPLLVLDEATSALDEATEAAVLDGLSEMVRRGRTIIFIAHRASTMTYCQHIVRLKGGSVAEITTAVDASKATSLPS